MKACGSSVRWQGRGEPANSVWGANHTISTDLPRQAITEDVGLVPEYLEQSLPSIVCTVFHYGSILNFSHSDQVGRDRGKLSSLRKSRSGTVWSACVPGTSCAASSSLTAREDAFSETFWREESSFPRCTISLKSITQNYNDQLHPSLGLPLVEQTREDTLFHNTSQCF